MLARRKIGFRDIPIICLADGLIFALAALATYANSRQALPTQAELTSVVGTIQSIDRTSGKGGSHLILRVLASDGIHRLSQDDLSDRFQSLRELQVGDTITARVRRGFAGVDWYWELSRNGSMILSYEQTHQFFIAGNARIAAGAHWFALIALFFLVCGILLRICFGAWTGGKAASDVQPLRSQAN